MKIDGRDYRSIWPHTRERAFHLIDQTRLPHVFEILTLRSAEEAAQAIRSMRTRGAPLIGACGAYGLALALHADPSDASLDAAHRMLLATRPTAVNLRWALDRVRARVASLAPSARADAAWAECARLCDEDVAINRAIGEHGLRLLAQLARERGRESLDVMTHCNAGWLATVDYGTALAPIYLAHDSGMPIHVWVSETRPRNQGAALTAWELAQHGVPHTVIADNAAGHLMQRGRVDCVLVGADRVTRDGDVCNKIGTYLKAVAARDNDVPFYAAVPSPTIDWELEDGGSTIPIEERDENEVLSVTGRAAGELATVRIAPLGARAANFGFDVTPARLVTALITERGVFAPHELAANPVFMEFAQ